jgi:transcriptional regulator with XRE-family HTH domain
VSDISGTAGSTWATLLKTTRKSKGYTQDQLADEAGVHRTTVIRQERGEGAPDRAVVRRLARILGIPIDAALAAADGDLDPATVPPPLPREFARLVEIYSDLNEEQRKTLLERAGWVVEWAEGWLLSQEQLPGRRRRASG